MEHISYGLFERYDDARDAASAIEASGTSREHMGVTLHRGALDEGRLGASTTDAPEGTREGAAIAGILGAVAGGIVMGPIGLASGGVLGAIYGAIGGALAGAGSPDRNLEKLSKQLAQGAVLLVVEADSLRARDRADTAMLAHGGRVEHKPFF